MAPGIFSLPEPLKQRLPTPFHSVCETGAQRGTGIFDMMRVTGPDSMPPSYEPKERLAAEVAAGKAAKS